MGKNGDRMRAEKKKSKRYEITAEWLAEHDRLLIASKKDEIERDVRARVEAEYEQKKKEIDDYINAEWESREKMFQSGCDQNNFLAYVTCFLSISCRVLVEKFHWIPIPKDDYYDKRNRLARFSDYCIDELDKISGDELMDIRRYNEETYDLYGVKFELVDAEEE